MVSKNKKERNKQMKKLMIAAAIVCAAVIGQAANVAWSINGVTLSDPSGDLQDYTGYCFISNAGGTDTTTFAVDQILSMITSGVDPYDTLDAAYGTGAAFFNAIGSGMATSTKGIDVTGAGAETPKTLHAMAVIIDGYSPDEAANYQVVDLGDVTFKSTSTTLSAVGTASNDWKAIPEPTSGLLLILGVAGLALKRKRA